MNAINLTKRDRLLKLGEAVLSGCPPAVFICWQAALILSMSRLKNQKIRALQPDGIFAAAEVKVICIDKTGTLTKNTIDINGIFANGRRKLVQEIDESDRNSLIFKLFACCHQLQFVDGNLLGDDLDIKMFKLSGWVFEQAPMNSDFEFLVTSPSKDVKIKVIKIFEFHSENQSMSVVAELNNERYLFIKGSPEKLIQVSNKTSVPDNFSFIVQDLAS